MSLASTVARTGVLITVALTLLAGCGDDEASGPQRSAEQAHSGFATDLLQHDAQVLALLDLARQSELPPSASSVIGEVQMQRAAEVETLTQWLTEASLPIPATVRDHVNAGHGDHGPQAADAETGAELPGMPDADELAELDAATGEEFLRLLADLLGELNDGATEVADDYRDELKDDTLVELADAVAEQRAADDDLLDQITGD
ncbi:DUF305 domain-containing protein [Nocardioides dubius]|uniref:DUF305 domain-containing protein n=1 Tax=Nocardioides dubius TaxID=317019 RepID=A0ABP4EFR3_9ACTN